MKEMLGDNLDRDGSPGSSLRVKFDIEDPDSPALSVENRKKAE